MNKELDISEVQACANVPMRGKELRKFLVQKSFWTRALSVSFLNFGLGHGRVSFLINQFLIKNVLTFKRHFPAVLLLSNGPGGIRRVMVKALFLIFRIDIRPLFSSDKTTRICLRYSTHFYFIYSFYSSLIK